MFKNMRLAVKISLGFGILVAISVALGGIAVWKNRAVTSEATILANEYVHEVQVANEVERGSLHTMDSMRGYADTEQESFLTDAKTRMATLQKTMEDIKDLAKNSPHLEKLKETAPKTDAQVDAYETLMGQTETRVNAILADREKLIGAAKSYMDNCDQFLASQQTSMLRELGVGKPAAENKAEKPGTTEPSKAEAAPEAAQPVTPAAAPEGEKILQTLQEGNDRFVSNSPRHPHGDEARVQETVAAQHPVATILGCSDSRVPPEVLFDQGIGDLFLVRVAGNVADTDEIGSIEYGVEHLQTPLLVVLGHTKCGAVTAVATHAALHGSIPALVANIAPAVAAARKAFPTLSDADLVPAAVKENVWQSIADLYDHSEAVKELAKAGKVKVVGAIYHVEDGKIEFLGAHPNEPVLLGKGSTPESGASEPQQTAAAGKSGANLPERFGRIATVTKLIGLGEETRISVWKAQSMREPKIIEDALKNFDAMNGLFEELRKTTRDQANIQQIDATVAAAKAYEEAMKDLLANWTALDKIAADRDAAGNEVLTQAEETSKAGVGHTEEIAQSTVTSLTSSNKTLTMGLTIATALGIVLAIFLTRSITGPLNRAIQSLGAGSQQVTAASGQVSTASQQLAEGATEQASSLEETSATLEELASQAVGNAGKAKRATEGAETAQKAAQQANEAMTDTVQAMSQIKESSGKISGIIKTIEEIAFQTNLLALNAAVEAARAGDAGKGFAVVAEEVRNLAQRSAVAAKDTAQLIETSVKQSNEGAQVVGRASAAIERILEVAGKVASDAREVTTASEEQSQGIAQINTAVSQMDQVTQKVAASAEESASASEELSSQAQEMQAVVEDLLALVGGRGRNQTGAEETPLLALAGSHASQTQLAPTNQPF